MTDDLSQYRVDVAAVDPQLAEKTLAVDPKLPLKPLKVIRAILSGNGLKPDQVKLGEHSLTTIRFAADVRVKLTAKLAKRQAPGRDIKGDVVGDEQSLFAAVDKHINHIMATPALRQPILDLLLKRPDKGYAFNDKKLGFKTMNRQFVMHEACQTCHKSGVVLCNICEGRKQVFCPICKHQREVMCPTCKAEGHVHTQHGQDLCPTCRGKGRIACKNCGGDGLIKCKNCLATGRVKCRRCTGTGWMTTYLMAEIEALYTFTLDPKDIPPDLQRIMVELGPKLVERSVAEVDITSTITPEIDPKMPKDEVLITYKGRIPYGPIRFDIDGQSVGAMLYGYHGDLQDCPPFLERVGADAITRLLTAAENRREAGTMLPNAARARFIRDALHVGLMRSRTRALEMYKKRYPYGLSDQMIRDLLVLAETATRNASKDYRLFAMLGSMAVIVATSALYYIGPGLQIVQPMVPNVWAELGVDLGIMVILLGAAYQLPRIAGSYALKRLLGGVMEMDKVRGLMPKAGRMEWIAVGTVPAIMAACILVAKITGGVVPAWLHLFGLS